jgi:IS5 family transposase
VSANVEYPTDSGLLARAVTKIGKLVRRIKAAGGANRTVFRDRSRSATARVRAIGAKLKLRSAAGRDEAQATVMRLTGELARLAEHAGRDAYAVLDNARRALRRVAGRTKGRLRRAIDELATTVERTRRVVAQTRRRLAGGKPDSATRLVSLHDPDARPIAKGRLNRPIEFGYKAQVIDNEDGIVLDHTVEEGNPADAPQLAPAIQRIARRTGQVPAAVTADRGYGEARVEADLRDIGVKTVAIPRKGQPGSARQAIEHRRGFRYLIKWRTGCEGRISHLKHRYGWDRSGATGRDRTATWCGHGIFAHNLVKITALAT